MKVKPKIVRQLKNSFIQLLLAIGKLIFKLFSKIPVALFSTMSLGEKWLSKKNSPYRLQEGSNFFKRRENAPYRSQRAKKLPKYLRLRKPFPLALSPKGFVLPTMTMVLLVFSLVVGAILWRTSQYTQEVINDRQAQVIYNSATPAIERAKTKLEFLFKRDYRFPNTVPGASILDQYLLNRNDDNLTTKDQVPRYEESSAYVDIYTLPGETRIDINGDNQVDNAWSYQTDLDGNGTNEQVVYAIIAKNSATESTTSTITLDSSDAKKAKYLVTRTGPLSILNGQTSGVCANTNTALAPQEGWYTINNSSVRKNFQIDAIVINKNPQNKEISALEFQQDRQLDKGNKWGVWFRYDLEAYPGKDFHWNGAMYTGGNYIWGENTDKKYFYINLISSPNSCFYTEDASEIAMTQVEDDKGNILFQGQAINGTPFKDNWQGASNLDIYPGAKQAPRDTPPPDTNNIEFNKTTDSISDNLQTSSSSPYNFSLDPIVLFTEDISKSRYTTDPTNVAARATDWTTNSLSKRIINKLVSKPYVDDTYRADNRWGPKPNYTTEIPIPSAAKFGTTIDNYIDTLTKNDPPTELPADVGLDGYWERRARAQGLRILVGQRLELGNTNGWQGKNLSTFGTTSSKPTEIGDPLYPPPLVNPTKSSEANPLTNLARQRRTLRDNVAAVQSTLVYHNASQSGLFPVATIASTVHNGSVALRNKSRTFDTLSAISSWPNLETDFLTGKGTNGWEFNAPGNVTTAADFKALIDDTTDPLRIALTNLAYFAGDPDGAFPPKQEAATTPASKITHPYPYLTMWGDFSNLRRVISLLDGSTSYNNLSPADQTTLHTAAATLGLLAYNLDNYVEVSGMDGGSASQVKALGEHMWQLIDGNTSNGEVTTLLNLTPPSNASLIDLANFYLSLTPDQYISALMADNGLGSDAQKQDTLARASALITELQIDRDRTLGFIGTSTTGEWSPWYAGVYGNGVNDIVFSQTIPPSTNSNGKDLTQLVALSCDPNIFSDALGNGSGLESKKLGLALALCPRQAVPKYPSLFYLFPKNNHDHTGINPGTDSLEDNQPATEEYIADTYISSINSGKTYKQVKDGTANDFSAIALQPRQLANWVLPKTTTDTGTDNTITGTALSTSPVYTAFLDKAFYDGRQLMQIRALDVDLNLLKTNQINSESWLTKSGIIYAFREDALREDGIARPASAAWSNCDTESELQSSTCRMDVNGLKDPPVNSKNGISTKPVDFYADPDRRPYGFRLKNGSDLSRTETKAGISFISDNTIYIQGNFNLHQNSSGTKLQEFTQALTSDWSNFYTRGNTGQGTLDSNFATQSGDRWRVAEILGDAVSILTNNFCDGTFEDGMLNTNGSDCSSTNSRNSSYLNSVLALATSGKTAADWKREKPTDISPYQSSIYINRNADIVLSDGSIFTSYRGVNAARTDNNANSGQIVNVILINALVPSRQYQSYGGLHNFPRLLQNWTGQNLEIAGAFFQLNFSTSATASWDQEAWEPGSTPSTGESKQFYEPPNRLWGYDIALQYSNPSPIASRFINVGTPRNEFYDQPQADDPYIMLLRCAKVNSKRVDSNLTDSQCTL
ncbi:hormogonium polysaccharide biosynthesis protein HpsA [Gloeothece verrucosa]|uniref:Uncharacterized protein n=1 Tax=Gloeothece verrucosa (strain PCC 7822) TaxID=497965 RepID=E0U928_GLOV7|nr:hormogonium polysaccharide biosynthesis protein HpsA [Gloeothece verrucosa]ADN16167.1 hypothetical protein Cyan7822_4249 [Gloeothece verrucosa PCC 7822]